MMTNFLKRIINDERGQALPIALALLVLGGLTIVPSLNYAATGLNSGRTIQEGMEGLYAADAGVENALWCLENGVSPVEQLSETINQVEVAIQTEDRGTYTLSFGELVQAGVHGEYLSVHGEIVWDGGAGAYKYTITVTWQPNSGVTVIHLEEVGARLPVGYSYQSGSAAVFADNLSIGEPDETLDAYGAYLLKWEFEPPLPSVSESDSVQKQAFYITGEGSLEGDYTWVIANREDIGEVGEITGTLYIITATATNPATSEVTAEIVADVVLDEGTLYIIAWQVLK